MPLEKHPISILYIFSVFLFVSIKVSEQIFILKCNPQDYRPSREFCLMLWLAHTPQNQLLIHEGNIISRRAFVRFSLLMEPVIFNWTCRMLQLRATEECVLFWGTRILDWWLLSSHRITWGFLLAFRVDPFPNRNLRGARLMCLGERTEGWSSLDTLVWDWSWVVWWVDEISAGLGLD